MSSSVAWAENPSDALFPRDTSVNEEPLSEDRDKEKQKAIYMEIERRAFSDELAATVGRKKKGTITRARKKHVEIDLGSINTVHERDVYEVYDASGAFKGLVEMEGIGENRSIGQSYGKKDGLTIQQGDEVRFRGQRRFLEFGLMYGSDFKSSDFKETLTGGGLVWKWNFMGAWGIDFLWSSFSTNIEKRPGPMRVGFENVDYKKKVSISFPIGIRKYFHYPTDISPFLGGGAAFVDSYYKYIVERTDFWEISFPSSRVIHQEGTEKRTFVPYGLIGVDLFAGRRVHVGLEGRYFHGPILKGERITIKVRPIISSLIISTTW